MCSLCGILGGGAHWTDSTGHPEAFQGRSETRRGERQMRTRLVNHILGHYGLSLSDWAGASYVLKSNTGRTALVENLSEIWTAADALGQRTCDPLDEALLRALKSAEP